MSALILDGRALADRLQEPLRARAAALAARTGDAPRLAIIGAGTTGAAAVYAASVARAARRVGIEPLAVGVPPGTDAWEVAARIAALNADPSVAGIVIAQPLPAPLDDSGLVDLVDPAKDVDGATAVNAGRLARGEPAPAPATARAVMEILRANQIEVAGRRAVVVGRSPVIGRPVAALLIAADATVTVCHRRTPDLAEETRRAEILVVAAGAPGLIRAEMVQPGCVVIDCGITARDGGVVGDVDFAAVSQVAAAITPVPGGVGPVTAVMLASQTLDAAERLAG
ncbi:MAG TPA: bifunctional 5,10-methylenetetrahydrofolate dehydrogenase/5,10-methenyltetrahydrofolate cyclohydrolase [Candidatus Limnocylindria bacterium]|nr:bifunctional 5,10-methylenetetrahydrofolate dehydrogenase/5,10-methenyltetrahydrofolate cyclohydrolase [Candidatus Limnocylindria bacterium]